MPKVTVEVGGVRAHCTPAQVQRVCAQLRAEAAEAGHVACMAHCAEESDGEKPWRSDAVNAIVDFVEESHAFLAKGAGRPIPDLSHGINFYRRLILMRKAPGPERFELLANLKFLDRLSVVAAEVRHYSRARLQESARKNQAMVQKYLQDEGVGHQKCQMSGL